jgi:hypothetical protein
LWLGITSPNRHLSQLEWEIPSVHTSNPEA